MISFVFVLYFVSTAVSAAVVKEQPQGLCSDLEYRCSDGSCISLASLCDGRGDCSDGADENSCSSGTSSYLLREKRQLKPTCTKDQWQCRDGSCIHFHEKCDGAVNCADGSDETHALCRLNRCLPHWFQCTYGACVDGNAPCDGVRHCADNSDELLPACYGEIPEANGRFLCQTGEVIPSSQRCDGVPHCADASDETVRACAGIVCAAYLFQCAYGACVDAGADCNGIKECYDGSDESEELCSMTNLIHHHNTTVDVPGTPGGKCVLPPYPKNGVYNVLGAPRAVPGEAYESVDLTIMCYPGYYAAGGNNRICINGKWNKIVDDCVGFCYLAQDPSVEYRCPPNNNYNGYRLCEVREPLGTMVKPVCRKQYYSPQILQVMECQEKGWNYIARCEPGLTKNGTNVTILIKDKNEYEVFVTNFEYSVAIERPGIPLSNNNQNSYMKPAQNSVFNNNIKPSTPNTNNVKPNNQNYETSNSNKRPAQNSFQNRPSTSNSDFNKINTPNSKLPGAQLTTLNPETEQVTPVTPVDPANYNIDKIYWRFQDSPVDQHQKNQGNINLNPNANVLSLNPNDQTDSVNYGASNVKAEKSTTEVNRDAIVFRD